MQHQQHPAPYQPQSFAFSPENVANGQLLYAIQHAEAHIFTLTAKLDSLLQQHTHLSSMVQNTQEQMDNMLPIMDTAMQSTLHPIKLAIDALQRQLNRANLTVYTPKQHTVTAENLNDTFHHIFPPGVDSIHSVYSFPERQDKDNRKHIIYFNVPTHRDIFLKHSLHITQQYHWTIRQSTTPLQRERIQLVGNIQQYLLQFFTADKVVRPNGHTIFVRDDNGHMNPIVSMLDAEHICKLRSVLTSDANLVPPYSQFHHIPQPPPPMRPPPPPYPPPKPHDSHDNNIPMQCSSPQPTPSLHAEDDAMPDVPTTSSSPHICDATCPSMHNDSYPAPMEHDVPRPPPNCTAHSPHPPPFPPQFHEHFLSPAPPLPVQPPTQTSQHDSLAALSTQPSTPSSTIIPNTSTFTSHSNTAQCGTAPQPIFSSTTIAPDGATPPPTTLPISSPNISISHTTTSSPATSCLTPTIASHHYATPLPSSPTSSGRHQPFDTHIPIPLTSPQQVSTATPSHPYPVVQPLPSSHEPFATSSGTARVPSQPPTPHDYTSTSSPSPTPPFPNPVHSSPQTVLPQPPTSPATTHSHDTNPSVPTNASPHITELSPTCSTHTQPHVSAIVLPTPPPHQSSASSSHDTTTQQQLPNVPHSIPRSLSHTTAESSLTPQAHHQVSHAPTPETSLPTSITPQAPSSTHQPGRSSRSQVNTAPHIELKTHRRDAKHGQGVLHQPSTFRTATVEPGCTRPG